MSAISEHAELLGYLRGRARQDLLAALPLVSSHIETTPVLEILRASCSALEPDLKRVIKRPLCVVAFGSLGRREYVSGVSDLDPLIVIKGSVSPSVAAKARAAILAPLATTNPWLALDHRQHVVSSNWSAIENVSIPYPVLGTDELLSGTPSALTAQRQWQVLLEGRPLMNSAFFDDLYEALLPRIDGPHQREIDFHTLTVAGGTFFGGFDNPVFLYKSPFKYFKTRFLRDFFVFGTQLTFLLGYYLQRGGEHLHSKYIRAATINKMIRALQFARQLDQECSANKSLNDLFVEDITSILKAHDLQWAPILQFGSEQYDSLSARYLHGLLMNVLSRFSACWEQVYDPHVRSVLAALPRDVSVDSAFPQHVTDPHAVSVLAELRERRDSYRKYMSATASVIRNVFPRGRTWAMVTVPRWIGDALVPFMRTPDAT